MISFIAAPERFQPMISTNKNKIGTCRRIMTAATTQSRESYVGMWYPVLELLILYIGVQTYREIYRLSSSKQILDRVISCTMCLKIEGSSIIKYIKIIKIKICFVIC